MPASRVRGCENLDVEDCILIWPDISTVAKNSIQVKCTLADRSGTTFDADQELTIHRVEHPLQVGTLPKDVEIVSPSKDIRSHQHISAFVVPRVCYVFELKKVQFTF